VRLSAVFTIDAVGVAAGGAGEGARVLGDLVVNLDADLQAALGWQGASLHVSGRADIGGQPNLLAATLQGIDNFEVPRHTGKLYEASIDQSFAAGKGDLRLGLYAVDGEFDVTDAAALFLQPTMGTSPELASTGLYGPAIFPSTALGARLNLQPRSDVYLRVAAVNALAGDPGDPQGVNLDFRGGLFVIAESGWTGEGKLAVGAWIYTHAQPDVRATGAPRGRRSEGAYLTLERPLYESPSHPQISGFLRLGLSDGETGPFKASGAAGLTAGRLFAGRPASALALGLVWGALSSGQRANGAAAGAPHPASETGLELTYADKLGARLQLQPDLQYIHNPAGGPAARDALILTLRAQLGF